MKQLLRFLEIYGSRLDQTRGLIIQIFYSSIASDLLAFEVDAYPLSKR